MFDSLSERLSKTIKNLRGQGRLDESNIKDALREVRMAMLEAGPVRLRPVMMTTFSTVCGMIPVAFATTGASEWRTPMGLIISGGLLSSMFLTLIVVPVGYTLVADWAIGLRKTFSRLQESIG